MSSRPKKLAAGSMRKVAPSKGPQGLAVFAQQFEATLPLLYVWAELRIPASARPLIEPDELVAEIWRQAAAQWPKANIVFRQWLLETAHTCFTDTFNLLKRELLFRGGSPGSLKLGNLLEVPSEGLALIHRWRRGRQASSLLQQLASLTPVERRVLLNRGIEALSDEEAASSSQLSPEELVLRWQNLRQRFERWPDLLEKSEPGEAQA